MDQILIISVTVFASDHGRLAAGQSMYSWSTAHMTHRVMGHGSSKQGFEMDKTHPPQKKKNLTMQGNSA